MIEQAAEWAALLDDVSATEADRDACTEWCAEHPLHRAAFERIGGISARFDALDPAQKRTISVVNRPAGSTKRIAGGLACLALLAGTGWMASQTIAVRSFWPDYSTGIGEQRTLILADGSQLVADTSTRFDGFSEVGERKVLLFAGQVMARVARDPRRPFVVETAEGRATALGTVYSVKRDNGRTIVTVVESRVRLCPARAACRTLAAGARAAMTADGVSEIERVDPEGAALWTSGWIEVHDVAVSYVLAELQRYHAVPIRYDPARLGQVRVTGSFPLNRPEDALRSIASVTGLKVATGSNGALVIGPR
jgi:transmembrane sensor